MYRKIGYSVVALVVAALVGGLASPASAEDTTPTPSVSPTPTIQQLQAPEGFQLHLGDCGQLTILADSLPYNVSSGKRTAGLAVRVGDDIAYTEPTAMDNGSYMFDGSLTVGPLEQENTTVEYRWFAGPDRNDLPAWDLDSHPDWVDIVTQQEDDQDRHWDAGNTAPFVPWHSVEVDGCPVPDPTPTPTGQPADPTPTPTPADQPLDQTSDTLPDTGTGWVLPAAIIGATLVVSGAVAIWVTRRPRQRFTA